MLSNQELLEDPLYDIIYSLPALTHSVAIATRSPTVHLMQKSKYIPDYGGILETQDSFLKNSALASQIPFKLIPETQQLDLNATIRAQASKNFSSKLDPACTDCLVIKSDDSLLDDRSILITAVEDTLIFHSIEKNPQDQLVHTLLKALKIGRKICGIKLSCDKETLIVKLKEECKALKILIDTQRQRGSCFSINLQSIFSVDETREFAIKDGCLNQFNRCVQGVASDNNSMGQVKLYDISGNPCEQFYTIQWEAKDDSSHNDTMGDSPPQHRANHVRLRGNAVRKFIPILNEYRGIQQLDCIPSHLVNMLLTTGHRTTLIDPRIDKLGQVYVDKSKIPSFYPIEYIRRLEFSERNSYQFYSMTNVNLRVFDTRYPGVPMNQVSHMLDSDDYDKMHLKIIDHHEDLETLCCSSGTRLSFSTFNQSIRGKLVNPQSIHLPYHDGEQYESIVSPNSKLFGLGIIKTLDSRSRNNCSFSVLQLSADNQLTIREYLTSDSGFDIANEILKSQADNIIDYHEKGKANPEMFISDRQCFGDLDLDDRDILNDLVPEDDRNYINLLEDDLALDANTHSQRAFERFEKMKAKLG